MAISTTRSVLRIFIASPNDLTEERHALRRVVEELNQSVGHPLNWTIELLGWEDTLPGFTRPQEAINKDVDSCDLFVGMLWRGIVKLTGKR
jgi:hypothetical protein